MSTKTNRPGQKSKPASKSEHVTICLLPVEKAKIEAAAEDLDIKSSPLIHRYLFDRTGQLRPVPRR